MTDSTGANTRGPVVPVIMRAVLIGMLVILAGTIPRNIIFAANLRLLPGLPWAVPVTAVYLWFFWRYLRGDGPPESTSEMRRASLRANRVSGVVWAWALLAGGLGIMGLVLALWVANRLVVLPPQALPNLAGVPKSTVLALLLMAAPVAGIIEEASFRGYMQGPIEQRCGLSIAILITGTMFAVAHLDFTLILWPYYVAVAAIYGVVNYLTKSILPALVLHTCGNLYSNIDLWLHGQADGKPPRVRRR
ncbi:MAG: CPBP family intramembrane metalloprotease [Verrucomicrobiota bacterium]|nr:CPBP family intramembrane metalloprotease [Verrucomicrobiota bacterium]